MSPDILQISTSSNKFFNGVTMTNQSGTVDWQGGTLFLSNAAQITNRGLWNATGNNSINPNGGAVSSFVNNGIFRKSGGAGATTINGIAFMNDGVIDARTGSINFAGNNATFNAGSQFTGAGDININSNAAFNGGFSSANLNFNSGTFTGTNAVLNGSADFTAGTFSGSWNIASGSDLSLLTTSNKLFNTVDFTNNGTIDWQNGTLFLSSGSQITNNGTVTIEGNNSINPNGGAVSSFVNNGVFRKSGGAGATTINGIAFVNDGVIDARTGSINFAGNNATFNAGSQFTGAGDININSNAAFNGGFSSANLNFNSGTFTGTNAVLNGSADFTAGTFSGSWNIASGSDLSLLTTSNKFFNAADFTNDGTVNWQNGTLFLSNGSQITNNGIVTIEGNNSINPNGGAASSFVNNGLIEKTAGGGVTSISSSIGFDNQGTVNVLSGTIALPTNFANDGTLGGTGNFSLSGTLTNAGTIAPGATGTTGSLMLTGDYLQLATGTLSTQLASASMFDVFNISSDATLGGTLALSCIFSCNISTGDSFVILTAGDSLSGIFDNFTTSGFLNGFDYDVVYDYANRQVRLDILNAGATPPIGAVPEPATWAMMILGFGLIGGVMRRRRSPTAKLRISYT